MKRRWRSLLFVIALALVLAGAREAFRRADVVEGAPAAGAEWIWAPQLGEPGTPTAFFAVKDFELDFAVESAELKILADEEFLVSLNERPVGVGNYEASPHLASFPVGNILRRRNRLLVELRSARGIGGLLLRLDVEGEDGERLAMVSDGSWRVVRRFDATLPRPASPYSGQEPKVWGAQPTGRWGQPTETVATLTLRNLQNGEWRPLVPAVRDGRHGSPWRAAPRRALGSLGPWARFDFGRVRTGYLNLRFEDAQGARGFVYYDLRRPPQGLEGWGDVVLRVAGRDRWTASRPASFRFLTVVGLPGVTGAEIVPVNPEKVSGLVAREPHASLFGIARGKTLMSPVEDEVRSKLQRVPGLARRKEG